jgi:L-lactate dehydrogenase complex protein LldF
LPDQPLQRKTIRSATQDSYLKLALERSAKAYEAARAQGMAGVDFEGLRAEIRVIKERSIARLPELIERFCREAERVNAVVYEAESPEDAQRYIAELARDRGVELIVKSKSMLTEEIELNKHLESAGMKVVETDLGEWIIQLAGEKPSHFTQPAAHKTREQVAELFSKVTGKKLDADIPQLIEVARNELRRAFVEAQMGITGANIAVAETGSLVIVTNEGNSRLVSTLPPIHVAVVGYEKLVESLDDANAIIKLLARSGTGQKMTAYVSYITGPSRTTDIEKTLALGVHGPKELHIVFVNNGRTAMRDDEDCAEALYCLKCGACLNVCPAYRAVGGHVYGNSYIGGIGAVVTAFHRNLDSAEPTLGLCNGCGKCVSVCPSLVDTPGMTLALRERLVREHGLSTSERLKFEMFGDLSTLETAAKMARAARIPMLLAKPFLNQTSVAPNYMRMGLAFSGNPLRNRLPEVTKPEGKPVGRAAFYAGCLIDAMYPEIGEAVVKVLTKLGIEVSFPKAQVCCGAPMVYAGDTETAKSLAEQNVKALRDVDYVITACPTCAVGLKEDTARLLEGTELHEEALSLADKVKDFNDYLINILHAKEKLAELIGKTPGKVTYHDPCHLIRGLGISAEPRANLAVAGLELVEMPESDVCCGFAGSHSFKYPDISESILQRKIANVKSVEPDIVATDCPGCILHIRGGMTTYDCPAQVKHTAEILAERMKE